jgi:hypothetical protein
MSYGKRRCAICNDEFFGEDWMTHCRPCYWQLKGFSWQCPKRKQRHTPEELRQLTYGWPFGSGMWSNKQVLLTIKAIGGFEQYSYESWDELWEAEIHTVEPPVTASGPCLLCVIRELKAKYEQAQHQ